MLARFEGDAMFIDADTHVDECEATWSYLPPSLKHLEPRTLEFSEDDAPSWLRADAHGTSASGYYRFWFIDGKLAPRRIRSDERTGTTLATRELVDVPARLHDMDALNVETQVIYPTLFLHEISLRLDVCTALYKSYNRWLAEQCALSGGRLRWVAMIPYISMPDALEEIRYVKEHGAVGIFKLGIDSGGRAIADPYFFPAYELAAELGLALCIHTGTAYAPVTGSISEFPVGDEDLFPVLGAFAGLLSAKVPELIAKLRVGFIESSSAWLPYLLGTAGWRWDRPIGERARTLANVRFFITSETGEDLPYLINVAGGDDSFVVGSDYTHGDRYAVFDAHRKVAERTDIDEKSALKITSENARSLYGL